MAERLKINQIEASTPLWFSMRAHYESRLSNLRAQNDNPANDPAKTAFIRGQIAEVKALLTIDKPDKGQT